jgi:predicted Zn-dependent protease with MMP-like domain
MERARFEQLVAQAVETLPDEFQERLENVDVVVEDYPSRGQMSQSRLSKDMTLLGLYEGVPLTERYSNYGMVAPDKITIFQKTIEEKCRSRDEMDIKVEISRVVIHEIAHHFGIGDERLDEIEKEKGWPQ